jgi:NTP pyrophosphatase (non-canonical NTP hydrolase)
MRSKEDKMTRECVEWFAKLMEEQLKANDHKGGWSDEDTDYLLGRLDEEVQELKDALVTYYFEISHRGECQKLAKNVRKECADVANFAMMIADTL